MEFSFKDKTILVTGYFSDIGRGICNMYTSLHGDVISTYNNTFKENEICSKVKLFKLDLESLNSIYNFIESLKANNINKIDILVNNIGIHDIDPLIFQSDDKILSLMNVNLTNTIILTKYILRDFMEDNGRVINISSIWGRIGASCEVVYSSSKGGVNIFTKALSKEMRSRGIKVLGIAPGFINTKMNKGIDSHELLAEIALRRIGETYHISDSVKFFSSDYINITGEIINIDGGWMI